MSELDIAGTVNAADEYQIPSGPEPPRWPVLEPAALYGLAGEFVELVEPHTEADAVALLGQFLTSFGNAAGKAVCRAPDGTAHYLNLFMLLCGSSSKARKGSSWYFVKQIFERADPEWTRDRVQSGLSSGEGVIWAVRDAITKREPVREKGRIVDYQDVEVDPGVTDKRLMLFESEFASVLRVLAREGNTLSATIRQMHDTGDLRTMTKNSPAKATGAHISIIAHITSEEYYATSIRPKLPTGSAIAFYFCALDARNACRAAGVSIKRPSRGSGSASSKRWHSREAPVNSSSANPLTKCGIVSIPH